MIRIGVVPYLNAKPLYMGLKKTVVSFPPVVLADKLRNHELDVALVPVAECLENPHYVLVDQVAIGCDGPVNSVILTSELPLEKIHQIALDKESKTSVLLTRQIFEIYAQQPVAYVSETVTAEAHLRIGDRALNFRTHHPHAPYFDLGQLWKMHTKLPFIFAVWAMRREVATVALAHELRCAKIAGLESRPQIATTPEEYRYLTECIRYDLGDKEKQGLEHFAKGLTKLHLIPQPPMLHWL